MRTNRGAAWWLLLALAISGIGLDGCGSGGSSTTVTPLPDTRPPTVVSMDPPPGAVGIFVNDPIIVSFSEPIDVGSVSSSSFRLTRNGTPVTGTVSASGRTVRFAPSPSLAASTAYQATIVAGIKDVAGNALASDATWTFTTIADSWQTINTVHAPVARIGQTAVWTGTQMILWGGNELSLQSLNTGGRFTPSPAGGSWSETSVASGVPHARTLHTAVWTGPPLGKMIVWGGLDVTIALNDGALYDPATDKWSAMTNTGAPSARAGHTAVWTGTEMIVWGGVDSFSRPLVGGGRFNPNGTGSWRAVNSNAAQGAPTPRTGHTAIWTGNEMIVWGGTDDFGRTNTGARYNPTTDTWKRTATANAPSPRANHTAVWTGTEMIVWGGEFVGALPDGARYNPATDTWSALSSIDAPSLRTGHTAVWTGVEMIVWGGIDQTGGRYRPATNTWRPTAVTTDTPTRRTKHSAVWTGKQMIVAGGNDNAATVTGGEYTP